MNQIPIAIKEEAQDETPKVYKSIAPSTAVTTTKPTASPSSHAPPLQKNVPAFLNKLYSMVNDPESDDLICWSDDGASFFVNRQEDFARKVLPRFFKHNKFSSFVRQLNMYGFHKVPHLQQGVLETDSESERWEFSNPHFQRNQPDLLLLVTRKKGPNTDEKEISNIDLQHILEEIQSIKKHQMNISTQLQSIQRDNQVLWQETVSARERHLRHQETIDKILRFLASVFSNGEKRAAIPRKRRFLLGPADGDDHEAELDHYEQQQQQQQQHQQHQDSLRPKKMPRQNQSSQQAQPSTPFNLDDYVNGKNDMAGLSASLPAHVKNSAASTPSSDLAEAIALNDHSKNVESNASLSSMNDFSNIANIPQLQNLQGLISLAQSNPHLLSQLTSEAFYGMPHMPPTTTSPQQLSSSPAITAAAAPQYPSSSTASSIVSTPLDLNLNLTSSSTTTPGQLQQQQQQQPPAQNARSLSQVTNSISNIAGSADALNQDIDDLGISLQALAQHLGFDPSKMSSTTNEMDAEHQNVGAEGDLLDMDEFLNTYGPDLQDSNETAHPDFSSATITDIPSTSNTRSPSPAVTVATASSATQK